VCIVGYRSLPSARLKVMDYKIPPKLIYLLYSIHNSYPAEFRVSAVFCTCHSEVLGTA